MPPTELMDRPASASTKALDGLARVLERYEPIALSQMDRVKLLKRADTKYILSESQARGVLEALADDYWALEVAGTRLQHYRTQYFDTPGFALYLSHHAGNAVRFKVRSRSYLDSGLSFFEVKWKNESKAWTTKHRKRTDGLIARLTPDAQAFVENHAPLPAHALLPTLWNDFVRVTLVGKRYPERVTLDLDLSFGRGDSEVWLPGIVIAEIKQDGINRRSDVFSAIRERSLHPTGISKYCVGVALLYDSVKHNNFKPKLRAIGKAAGGNDVWRYP